MDLLIPIFALLAAAVLSAGELAAKEFEGIELPSPYDWLLGEIEPTSAIFCAGGEGSGKSTFAAGFADSLAEESFDVLYVASEEGHSKTLQGLLRRVGATSPNLQVADYSSIEELKDGVRELEPDFIVLDSISWLDPYGSNAVDLVKFLKGQSVGFLFIAHLNKEGQSKGGTDLPYAVDIRLFVGRDERGQRIVEATKNRYAITRHIYLPKNRHEREMLEESPIPLPIRTTLGQINDLHSACSVREINRLLGTDLGAQAVPPGHEEPVELVFRRPQDDSTTLQMVAGGKPVATASATSTRVAIAKLLTDHTDWEVRITDQTHARRVLTEPTPGRHSDGEGGKSENEDTERDPSLESSGEEEPEPELEEIEIDTAESEPNEPDGRSAEEDSSEEETGDSADDPFEESARRAETMIEELA